jgi:uncharacterized protein YbcI
MLVHAGSGRIKVRLNGLRRCRRTDLIRLSSTLRPPICLRGGARTETGMANVAAARYGAASTLPTARTGTPPNGGQAAQISNLLVKLVNEHTGRGPTKTATYFNEDLISVVMRDALTKGERSLVRDGKDDLVLDVRVAFQQEMRADFIAGIESITGRKVHAFLSANHIDPDIAIESFVLEDAHAVA